MGVFDSLHSYSDFEMTVKTKARFVHDDLVQKFLKTVIETSQSRRKKLPKDQILFRAQRGFVWEAQPILGDGDQVLATTDVEAALPPERMVPKAEYAGDGRINPRGIPCLYLSSNPSAALAEMRPWVGAHVTLARFKVVRDCVVVDCSVNTTESFLLETVDLDGAKEPSEPDAATRETGVWGDIGYAFSKPVTRDEPHIDYVPTQILAEAFRSNGYHGVVYKSLLDETGKNIALFDPQTAQLTNRYLYKTQSGSLEFARQTDELSWPDSIVSQLRPGKMF
jgi:RES domain-containing protein